MKKLSVQDVDRCVNEKQNSDSVEGSKEHGGVPSIESQATSELNAAPPLCRVHQSLEDRGDLEVVYGNGCVACSLNERKELLHILAPHVPLGGWVDSVGFLRQKLAHIARLEDESKRKSDAFAVLSDALAMFSGIGPLLFNDECRAVTLSGKDYWAIPREIYDQLRALFATTQDTNTSVSDGTTRPD